VAEKNLRVAFPSHGLTPGSPVQPSFPDPSDASIVPPQAPKVCRTPVILIVFSKLPIEGPTLFLHWVMQVLLAPSRDRFKAAFEPFPHGPNVDCEVSLPASFADMR
jgi:hypothetical protein